MRDVIPAGAISLAARAALVGRARCSGDLRAFVVRSRAGLPLCGAPQTVTRSRDVVRCQAQQTPCRIMAVSDIHVEYAANAAWAERLSATAHQQDVLILAGDVCDDLSLLERTLRLLTQRFAAVFYVVGNHELWVRSADRAAGVADSAAKASRVLELCARLGVATAPRRLGHTWIVPLHSWHHKSFDPDPDIPGVPTASAFTVADYAACAWPAHIPAGGIELAQWFDALNAGPSWDALLAERPRCDVVSFSHFLPLPALLPEKRFLFFPNLPKAAGSAPLAQRVAALRPDLHIFGHTHFAWDATIDGVRYIQAPLGSPAERQRRMKTMCFDRFMAEAAQDPESAAWLPVEVYRFHTPPPNLHDISAPSSSDLSLAAALRAGVPGAAGDECADAGVAAAAAAPPAPTVIGESLLEVPALIEGMDDDPLHPAAVAEIAPLPRAAPAPAPAGGGRSAPCALRHGTMPPSLGAHWSEYYSQNPRTPWVTQLAPWVAAVYERRRRRGAAPTRK